MTWEEANLSLQLAAENRIGALAQMHADLARAQEDAAFDGLKRGATP